MQPEASSQVEWCEQVVGDLKVDGDFRKIEGWHPTKKVK